MMLSEEDDLKSCYFDANDGQTIYGDWSENNANLVAGSEGYAEAIVQLSVSPDALGHRRHVSQMKSEDQHVIANPDLAVPSVPSTKAALLGKRDLEEQRHYTSAGTVANQTSRSYSKQRSPVTSPTGGAHAREDGVAMANIHFDVRQRRNKSDAIAQGLIYDTCTGREVREIDDEDMAETSREHNGDLFLELANDQAAVEQRTRPPSRGDTASNRLSFTKKRRSLPAEPSVPASEQPRPKSSGHTFGTTAAPRGSRVSDLQRHVERHRTTPSRSSHLADDTASISSRSRSGAAPRYAYVSEHRASYADPLRSPELPQYGRRRPSYGDALHTGSGRQTMQSPNQPEDSYRSPVESFEAKHSSPDSASVDSDAADTVWDELDDLKSRIKKLEVTGKLPPTSATALTTEQSDRPRTATTAPTTIDSSPKHEKQDQSEANVDQDSLPAPPKPYAGHVVGGPDVASIHPNLHSALAKAKTLLSPSLYRSLEATSADALQLAAMTGSAGPQGTAITAAAIINGVTVSDRHVRRKADTMCRNLTDLVLALCEGKSNSASSMSSPVPSNLSAKVSPTLRYARNSLSPNPDSGRTAGRPLSRLEARRTSMLGSQSGSVVVNGSIESGEELSASEQGSSKSHPRIEEFRGTGRSLSRLQAARQRHIDGIEEDDDPTIRPPSRAMTDIGRLKTSSKRDSLTPQSSPSLRASLASRRANATAGAHDSSRLASRIASSASDVSHRPRLDQATPSMEEDKGFDNEYQSMSAAKRRISSHGGHGIRRSIGSNPNRATSLSQSRSVIVE